MPISLESRFHLFMKSVSYAESIDALLLDKQYKERQKGKRQADYLLFDRKVILELKTVVENPSSKVEEEMNKHRERKDFPLIIGQTDLQQVLRHLPDGEDINRLIYRNATS